jgi:hypothetical protein
MRPSFEHIVEAYNLSILTGPGDWSLEGGDLALTKDGDPITGDLAYNGGNRILESQSEDPQSYKTVLA